MLAAISVGAQLFLCPTNEMFNASVFLMGASALIVLAAIIFSAVAAVIYAKDGIENNLPLYFLVSIIALRTLVYFLTLGANIGGMPHWWMFLLTGEGKDINMIEGSWVLAMMVTCLVKLDIMPPLQTKA